MALLGRAPFNTVTSNESISPPVVWLKSVLILPLQCDGTATTRGDGRAPKLRNVSAGNCAVDMKSALRVFRASSIDEPLPWHEH